MSALKYENQNKGTTWHKEFNLRSDFRFDLTLHGGPNPINERWEGRNSVSHIYKFKSVDWNTVYHNLCVLLIPLHSERRICKYMFFTNQLAWKDETSNAGTIWDAELKHEVWSKFRPFILQRGATGTINPTN